MTSKQLKENFFKEAKKLGFDFHPKTTVSIYSTSIVLGIKTGESYDIHSEIVVNFDPQQVLVSGGTYLAADNEVLLWRTKHAHSILTNVGKVYELASRYRDMYIDGIR